MPVKAPDKEKEGNCNTGGQDRMQTADGYW